MSHYKTLSVKFDEAKFIVAALEALRKERGIEYEIDTDAQGYNTTFPAAFVIRRESACANYGDVAIVRTEDGYAARVDEMDYDHAHVKALVAALYQQYSLAKAHSELAAHGYAITSERDVNGKIVITATPPTRRKQRRARRVRVRR